MKPYSKIAATVKCIATLSAVVVGLCVLLVPGKTMAQNITMENNGSTATINPGNGTGSLGMNSWTVLGGQNQLDQQWFWYSVDGAPQQTIDTISTPTIYNFSNPSSPINDLGVVYQNSQLLVQLEYVLTGNGTMSGSADMTEFINVQNIGASSINLSFYQYSNFNLLQNNANYVSISGSPGAFTGALQTTSQASGDGIAEVIEAPYATYAEAASVYQTLNELNSGSYYDLNNNLTAGPGDVTWAFEWNETIDPGASISITKDKGLAIHLVPEPSTLALIVLGMGALGLTLRRKLV